MKVQINGQWSTAEEFERDDRSGEDQRVDRVALDEGEPFVTCFGLLFFGTLLLAICSLSVSFVTGHEASLPLHGDRFDEDGFKRR